MGNWGETGREGLCGSCGCVCVRGSCGGAVYGGLHVCDENCVWGNVGSCVVVKLCIEGCVGGLCEGAGGELYGGAVLGNMLLL